MLQTGDTTKPRQILWDWRSFFSPAVLEQGQRDDAAGRLIDFDRSVDWTRAVGRTVNGFYVFAKNIPASYEEAAACPRWDRLSVPYPYGGQEGNYKNYYSCSCSMGVNGSRCRHLANLMFRMEKERGPFLFEETEEEVQKRLRAEEEERERLEEEARYRKAEIVMFGHTHRPEVSYGGGCICVNPGSDPYWSTRSPVRVTTSSSPC